MNSAQLGQKGFSLWYPFNEQSIKNAPKRWGAYVIRTTGGKSFGRLRGKSDILYIGSTKNKRGLNQRLTQFLNPGPTQWTSQRINKFIKKYPVEVAWRISDEPRNLESELLQQYFKEHEELPPLNRAGSKLIEKIIRETIRVGDYPRIKLGECENQEVE